MCKRLSISHCLKQYNSYISYFTDNSVSIQHDNSTDTSKGQSPQQKTVPVADENVEEPVSKENTDETGAVKEKQPIAETDNRKGKLNNK